MTKEVVSINADSLTQCSYRLNLNPPLDGAVLGDRQRSGVRPGRVEECQHLCERVDDACAGPGKMPEIARDDFKVVDQAHGRQLLIDCQRIFGQ